MEPCQGYKNPYNAVPEDAHICRLGPGHMMAAAHETREEMETGHPGADDVLVSS